MTSQNPHSLTKYIDLFYQNLESKLKPLRISNQLREKYNNRSNSQNKYFQQIKQQNTKIKLKRSKSNQLNLTEQKLPLTQDDKHHDQTLKILLQIKTLIDFKENSQKVMFSTILNDVELFKQMQLLQGECQKKQQKQLQLKSSLKQGQINSSEQIDTQQKFKTLLLKFNFMQDSKTLNKENIPPLVPRQRPKQNIFMPQNRQYPRYSREKNLTENYSNLMIHQYENAYNQHLIPCAVERTRFEKFNKLY